MDEITSLAYAAVQHSDPVNASAVYNRAALVASDCGRPDLARSWCHDHARLRLAHIPLNQAGARCALEPLVNLGRLMIRAGNGSAAYALLNDLYEAVTNRTNVTIDGFRLPAETLTSTDDDHRELSRWIWSVVIADAPRALTSAGQWNDALAHVRAHHGVGHRLLDGLQIAVVAALTSGRPDQACILLNTSTPVEPWEHAIAACLSVLSGGTSELDLGTMLAHHQRLIPSPHLAVFHTRLGLAVLDAVEHAGQGTGALSAILIRQALDLRDGYAVRDLLNDRRSRAFMTTTETRTARQIVHDCALGQAVLPTSAYRGLVQAMNTAAPVFR